MPKRTSKKKPTFFRTSVSLPIRLKAPMERFDDQVNWSSIAARAFEAEIARLSTTMTIDYTVTLSYGEDKPDPNEPSPTEEDIVRWIVQGMAKEGIPSADVTCTRQ